MGSAAGSRIYHTGCALKSKNPDEFELMLSDMIACVLAAVPMVACRTQQKVCTIYQTVACRTQQKSCTVHQIMRARSPLARGTRWATYRDLKQGSFLEDRIHVSPFSGSLHSPAYCTRYLRALISVTYVQTRYVESRNPLSRIEKEVRWHAFEHSCKIRIFSRSHFRPQTRATSCRSGGCTWDVGSLKVPG